MSSFRFVFKTCALILFLILLASDKLPGTIGSEVVEFLAVVKHSALLFPTFSLSQVLPTNAASIMKPLPSAKVPRLWSMLL